MNISRKWLREFVDITATDKEYDSVMTLAGQKVETTERRRRQGSIDEKA